VLPAASPSFAVNVFPVVAELALLFSYDEVGRIGMLLEPGTPAHGPQFRKRGREAAAAHDAIGVLNFYHAVRLPLVAAVAQILDDVGPGTGHGDQNFARPLFGEMWRAHDNRGERLGVRGHVYHACSGHEGFPCPAFAHDLHRIVICEILHASYDGELLGGQRLSHEARKLRSGGIAEPMQWGIGLNNPAPELLGVDAEVVIQRGHFHGKSRSVVRVAVELLLHLSCDILFVGVWGYGLKG